MPDLDYIEFEDIESFVVTPLPYYGRNQSGYGRKMPSQYKIKLKGNPQIYRVYVCWISNAGTVYISSKGKWRVLSHEAESRINELGTGGTSDGK